MKTFTLIVPEPKNRLARKALPKLIGSEFDIITEEGGYRCVVISLEHILTDNKRYVVITSEEIDND